MDAAIGQILLGLLTNALSSVMEKTWSAGTTELLTAEAAVGSAVEELAIVEAIAEEVGGERLRAFLASPEAASCVRLLFVARVHGSDATTDELRAEFARAFERSVPGVDPRHAERLFSALAKSAERALHVAATSGDPAADQALGTLRFRALTEELAGVRHSLEALRRASDGDLDAYRRWEDLYRTQVIARHGTITPPSFDAAERVPIDDIYVPTTFHATARPDIAERTLSPTELARQIDRTVVLGDPGAGKSTFAQKLAYDLAGGKAQLPGGSLTPLLVTLKDYGAAKQERRIGLLEWMESAVSSDYQAAAPPGAIDHLLTAGRVAVILDGLDELLDTSYRREVAADVETFAARYVAAPILVTSRRVGYDQAPLDPRRFEVVRLSELDDEQILRYTSRWFGLRRELTEDERQRMAEAFLEDSEEAAQDLRRNTLMLALLCNIYRGEGYIPRKRPQVYEKCAVMLFERWDRGRRIVAPLEFERHLRPAIQHLAYWIYAEAGVTGGVSERALVQRATAFLLERRFDDEDEARTEAMRFVEFCRGRAWVFTDTGTTPDGERLYQFTHRTFLEYFAAEHLVRTHRTPADLGAVLRPHIHVGEWDVVAQLAFQLQDDNIDGAGDELLVELLADPGEPPHASLSFAARTLAFLVPRRPTCRAVARAMTRHIWAIALDRLDELPIGLPTEELRAVACVDRENFDPVSAALVDETVALLAEDDSEAAAEIALELAAHTEVMAWDRPDPETWTRWRPVSAAAFEALWPLLQRHVDARHPVAYDAFLFGRLDLDELARAHTTEALFRPRQFVLSDYIVPDVTELLLSGQLRPDRHGNGAPLGTRAELAQLGRLLADAEPPWQPHDIGHSGLASTFDVPKAPQLRDPTLDGAALFGAFAALATVAERAAGADEIDEMLAGIDRVPGWVADLRPWIRRRFLDERVPRGARGLPLDSAMTRKVARWSERRWSAVVGPRD